MTVKDKDKKREVKADYTNLIPALEEASKLSISFVFFPVVFLLIGVWLDKKFNTIPVFILVSIIIGFLIFAFQAWRAIKKVRQEK
ncbi:MAG: hypothetical protein US60_C0001G0036 [Microgenomates group bacterium GW2011_GWC1_37_8]|uniref:ATP synthase protein I n=2 Tax=Candidatus Woeseibacteriota TaxID=1752722 RepID=A0A0G0NK21_9BACT|nr:MAG: hypothetical protein US60_C0001G0036 [Microgenomates group bacterium GW2011_GWC1_37_8]KKQ86239.1 MAG: hypothetical protein UT08_C0001G0105 [Candidatus Woesebacteria bacterium GW2011_GWB1_38_8]OGM20361.1 MAG: hypothetical protein A2863_04475 [Candidatus Woesebacteria bacterium RIFCSPHIGHO2_01_FULL_38_9b]